MSNLDFCGNCGVSIHSTSRYCSKCQAYIDMEAVVLRHTWSDQEALEPEDLEYGEEAVTGPEDIQDLCEKLIAEMEGAIEEYQKICEHLKDLYTQVSMNPPYVEPSPDPIYCNERRC